jgi:hypothetical protein
MGGEVTRITYNEGGDYEVDVLPEEYANVNNMTMVNFGPVSNSTTQFNMSFVAKPDQGTFDGLTWSRYYLQECNDLTENRWITTKEFLVMRDSLISFTIDSTAENKFWRISKHRLIYIESTQPDSISDIPEDKSELTDKTMIFTYGGTNSTIQFIVKPDENPYGIDKVWELYGLETTTCLRTNAWERILTYIGRKEEILTIEVDTSDPNRFFRLR